MTDTALLLVDLQYDFLPGGALAVPDGDAVIPVANDLVQRFDLVVATQDWHPPGHESFASQHEGTSPGQVIELHGLQQVLWPDHCVQGTRGAALVDDLDTSNVDEIFQKGTDPSIDSYSGFFDNGHRKSTGLDAWLKEQGVTTVVVMGLATDYCVKFTALDARELGFRTLLVPEGCRAVELEKGDGDKALKAMRAAGVEILHRDALPG